MDNKGFIEIHRNQNLTKNLERKYENNWYIRNDSSNVSALLNSYLNEEVVNVAENDTKRPLIVSNNCYEEDTSTLCRDGCRCHECYCHKKPVLPILPLKPSEEKCSRLKNPQSKQFTNVCSSGYKTNFSRNKCNDFNEEYYSPLKHYKTPREMYDRFIEILNNKQKLQNEDSSQNDAINTNKSEKESLLNKDSSQNYAIDTNKSEKESLLNKDSSQNYAINTNKSEKEGLLNKDSSQNDAIRTNKSDKGDHTEMGEKSSSNSVAIIDTDLDADKDLKKINSFRKENYFDCHSIGEAYETDPNHKCIHKYILDNRLIPRPVNTDPYGTSCCAICNKSVKPEPSNGLIRESRLPPINNSKPKPPQQLPKRIRICNEQDGIEIAIPISFDLAGNIFHNRIKLKRPENRNSFALRYQKGVI